MLSRAGIQMAGVVGPMITDLMERGIIHDLNGTCGLSGWRWLFTIEGLISACMNGPSGVIRA